MRRPSGAQRSYSGVMGQMSVRREQAVGSNEAGLAINHVPKLIAAKMDPDVLLVLIEHHPFVISRTRGLCAERARAAPHPGVPGLVRAG